MHLSIITIIRRRKKLLLLSFYFRAYLDILYTLLSHQWRSLIRSSLPVSSTTDRIPLWIPSCAQVVADALDTQVIVPYRLDFSTGSYLFVQLYPTKELLFSLFIVF